MLRKKRKKAKNIKDCLKQTLPEEWYYALYYCALAILSKFGVESRSQRCTALFLQYAKDKGLIDYDDEFIRRIMVYKEKDKKQMLIREKKQDIAQK